MNERPLHEAFSPESTRHIGNTEKDKRDYDEAAIQSAWLFRNPEIEISDDFESRAQWFREVFLEAPESQDLIEQFRFQDQSEKVLDHMDASYLSWVTKH